MTKKEKTKNNFFNHIFTKIIHIFSLIVILLPFVLTLINPTNVYADSLQHGKDPFATKNVKKALNKCGNIYNVGVPASVQSTLSQQSEYNTDTQIFMTYLLFKNGFASTKGYPSLWNENDDNSQAVQEFNSDNVGLKISGQFGNKDAIKALSKYHDKNKQIDKAHQTQDAAPDGENKSQQQDQTLLDQDAEKIAKVLANNMTNAVALSSNRKPFVAFGLTGSGNSKYSQTKSFHNLHRTWDSTTLEAGYSHVKGINDKSYAMFKNGICSNNITSSSDYNDLICNNQSAPSKLVDIIRADVRKKLTTYAEQYSASEAVKKISDLTAGDVFNNSSDSESSFNASDTSLQSNSENDPHWLKHFFTADSMYSYNPLIPIEDLQNVSTKDINDSKYENDAIQHTKYLAYPMFNKNSGLVVANSGGSDTYDKFNQHFLNELNKKCNVKINESDIAKFKKVNKQETKQNKQSIGNNHIITWNWVAPTAKEWTKGNFKDDVASANNGVINFASSKNAKQTSVVCLSPAEIYSAGVKNSSSPFESLFQFQSPSHVDICLNGKSSDNISGSPISDLNPHFKAGSGNILQGYANIVKNKDTGNLSLGSNRNDAMGVDCYGNLVDGQYGPTVMIPYWQNVYINQYQNDFKGIKANPSLNDSTSKYFDYSDPAEFKVSQSQLKAIGCGSGPAMAIVDNANKYHGKSGKDYVSFVNKQVGASGSTRLSDKACAALAVLITAKTHDDVQKFNQSMLSKSKSNQELYIGKSTTKTHDAATPGPKGHGTYLYTATDIIQRAGLESDYGMFNILRKTFVSSLVNTYNNSIIQSGHQNIFYTQTMSDLGINNLGLLPFYICLIILGAAYLWLLIKQFLFKDTKVGLMSYVMMLVKVVGLVVIMLISPAVENMILNVPGEKLINKPLQEQSILDQWSNIRQEQSINNVLYSGLFGDTFGNINTSQSYVLPFYTTTRVDGSVDHQTQLTQKIANHQSGRDLLNAMADNQAAQLKGNGHVSFLAPIEYKTVNISSSDLLAWAIHMSRQIDTKNHVKGVYNTDLAEKPDGNYPAGECPLFVWLAKYYQPLGADSPRVKSRKNTEYGTTINGASYGSGDSAYGKRRNPADTSLKSAYRSGYNQNDTNDNGARYKDLDKYTEFAVNTQHFANPFDIKYGTDYTSKNYANTEVTNNTTPNPDKKGTNMLTASQLFLRIFETTYSTKGVTTANQTGKGNTAGTEGIENYNALMRFAQVLRGDMSTYVTQGQSNNVANQEASVDQGQNTDTGDVNLTNIGSVGRRDLINEVSMTKEQRIALNGPTQFNNATLDVMKSFHINKPVTDWLGLSLPDSPLQVVHPYYGPKQTAHRDGLIFKINKNFLNNYVNIYSNVRAEIQPSDADSEGSKNHGDEDSFSMAEAHIMALDEWFLINKYTHQRMFPTEYLPSSVSLDSWNRMLLIPIGDMKNRDDTAQYDEQNKVDPSQVALQDNTAEYLGLRCSTPSMLIFIIMQFLLILFGIILSLFMAIVCPILLMFSLIRAFFSSSTKISNILYGSLGAVSILGIMKFILIGTFAYFSNLHNNEFINGDTNLHIFSPCIIICVEVLLFLHFLFRAYFPALIHNIATMGNGQDGGAFGFYKNAFSRYKEHTPLRDFNGFNHRIGKMYRTYHRFKDRRRRKKLMAKLVVARHEKDIQNKINQENQGNQHNQPQGTPTSYNQGSYLIKKIQTLAIREKINRFKDAINFSPINKRHQLANELDNLENAKYGNIESTVANGNTQEKIDNANDGDILQNSVPLNNLDVDLSHQLTNNDLAKLKADPRLAPYLNNNKHLIIPGVNSETLKNDKGRKELFKPIINTLNDELKGINHSANGQLLQATKIYNAIEGELADGMISFNISSNENLNKLHQMLNLMDAEGFKLKDELQTDANNHIISQKLHFVPKDNMSDRRMNKLFNTNVQKIIRTLDIQPESHNYGVRVYDPNVAKQIKNSLANAVVDGDRVLVNSKERNDLDQIINNINNERLHDIKLRRHLIKGFNDYVVDGPNHGFNTDQMIRMTNSSVGNALTQIKSSNAKEATELINRLNNVAGQKDFNDLSYRINHNNEQINDLLLRANQDNPLKVAQRINNVVNKNNINLPTQTKHILNNLTNEANTVKVKNFSVLDSQYQNTVTKQYSDLIKSLKDNNQWINVQNGLSAEMNNLDEQGTKLSSLIDESNNLHAKLLSLIGNDKSHLVNNISNEKLSQDIIASGMIHATKDKDNNIVNLYHIDYDDLMNHHLNHNNNLNNKRLANLIKNI